MFNTVPMSSGVPSQGATPERLEVEKEEPQSAPAKTQWQQPQGAEQMQTSPTAQAPRAVQAIHKRRRVSRACDEVWLFCGCVGSDTAQLANRPTV